MPLKLKIDGNKLIYTGLSSDQKKSKKTWVFIAEEEGIQMVSPVGNTPQQFKPTPEYPGELRELILITPHELCRSIDAKLKGDSDFVKRVQSSNAKEWLLKMAGNSTCLSDAMLDTMLSTIRKNLPTFKEKQRDKIDLAKQLLAWKKIVI